MDYWVECIEAAFEDAGIIATKEQIKSVADDVAISHEQYGMAFGHGTIPNPLEQTIKQLQIELQDERDKIPCSICMGRGHITTHGPYHSATSDCWKCRGEGRIKP